MGKPNAPIRGGCFDIVFCARSFCEGEERCRRKAGDQAQTSQITSAPEMAAMRVKGMSMRMKSRVETL